MPVGIEVSGLHYDHRTAPARTSDASHGKGSRFDKALSLLMQGYRFAHDLKRDVWDFAVEIAALRRVGLTANDLRWMVCKGYVEHARELSSADDDARRFRPGNKLRYDRRSCFVLTSAGLAMAEQRCQQVMPIINGVDGVDGPLPLVHSRPAGWDVIHDQDLHDRPLPQWDCDRREIRISGQLVKQFKLPSPNQETILMAFEEEGWPPRIDDPLPSSPLVDPKRRLHDTIRSLNRNQKERLLRFKGDGTGEGILWEHVSHHAEQQAEAAHI